MPKKHIPNILTVFRIVLIPAFLYLLFSDTPNGKLWALIVFLVAAVTDTFDGRIARKYNLVSKTGIFLDPLADKFLVLSAFISFWIFGEVKLWMLILIAFRDVLVTALRMVMQFRGITMITSKAGKLKTTLQMTVIILILLFFIMQSYHITGFTRVMTSYHIIYFMMVITTLVTFYTGLHYFFFNYKTLKILFQNS